MANKKKVIIINQAQFGYHTDYYKYCEYLSDFYNVTYICFNERYKKLKIKKVNCIYTPIFKFKLISHLIFLFNIFINSITLKGIIILKYFPNCRIIKYILPLKKIILDIRTLSIETDVEKRTAYNLQLKKNCKSFKYITIISEGVAKQLKIDNNNSYILPLGADCISKTKKNFSNINLLYVGTFYNRNIHITIEGIAKFIKDNPNIKISYDIIGFGTNYETERIISSISCNNLNDIVTFHGRIPHFKLKPYFDKNNVGVSFVPITEWYDFQPVTKTYEYLMSGLACIGTKTHENSIIINSMNGVICKDNAIDFACAIEQLIKNKDSLNSHNIRNSVKDFSWEKIVYYKLIPIIEEVEQS